jgi:hypothetical protein
VGSLGLWNPLSLWDLLACGNPGLSLRNPLSLWNLAMWLISTRMLHPTSNATQSHAAPDP